jgi:hypothetical protein
MGLADCDSTISVVREVSGEIFSKPVPVVHRAHVLDGSHHIQHFVPGGPGARRIAWHVIALAVVSEVEGKHVKPLVQHARQVRGGDMSPPSPLTSDGTPRPRAARVCGDARSFPATRPRRACGTRNRGSCPDLSERIGPTRQYRACRSVRKSWLRKGSGVVFGQSVFHVVRRGPKTTPDPVRAAYHQTKSDSYCFPGPNSRTNRVWPRTRSSYPC